MAGIVAFPVQSSAVAVSRQEIDVPLTPIVGFNDFVEFASIPITWQGPVPVNPRFNNVRVDIDLELVSRFAFRQVVNGALSYQGIYLIETADSSGAVFGLPSPVQFSGVSGSTSGRGAYNERLVDSYSASFRIEIDPLFNFASDEFFTLNLLAFPADYENDVRNFSQRAAATGRVRIRVVEQVPAPAALTLFGIGAAALAFRRRTA